VIVIAIPQLAAHEGGRVAKIRFDQESDHHERP
jgi:hypothetical protein